MKLNAMYEKIRVTPAMVSHWIGSDHDSKEDLLALLVELANGDYSSEELREDVLNHCDGQGVA
jgi:hypothetical protein